MASTSGGADCSQNLRKAVLRGLFVNVAEHVGEGKYSGSRGGGMEECAICCMESLKGGHT